MTIDNRIFDIRSPEIYIQNFIYKISRDLNKLKIFSTFEILGDFNLPPNVLGINHKLSNQHVDLLYLKKQNNQKCKNWSNDSSLNCYVFTNESFFVLNKDPFFARKIFHPINLEIATNFNLSSPDALNSFSTSKSKIYLDFVNNLKNLTLKHNFLFQNSHKIIRNKNDSVKKTEQIVTETILEKNKDNKYVTENIEVLFPHYDNGNNTNIQKWFQLNFPNQSNFHINFEIIEQSLDINFSTFQQNILFKNLNTWTQDSKTQNYFFFSNNNISKNQFNHRWEENLGFNSGLSLPEKSNGFMNLNFLLNYNSIPHLFHLSNFFEFSENQNVKDYKMYISREKKFNSSIFVNYSWEKQSFKN